MELKKPGNSPGPGPEVVRDRESQKVYSRTEQNEMRDVLERVSAGVARRIFDSANPREIRAQQ